MAGTKTSIFSLLCTMVLAVICVEQPEPVSPDHFAGDDQFRFKVSIEPRNGSKTTLSGTAVKWNSGAQLSGSGTNFYLSVPSGSFSQGVYLEVIDTDGVTITREQSAHDIQFTKRGLWKIEAAVAPAPGDPVTETIVAYVNVK